MQRIVITSLFVLLGVAAMAQKHNPGFHLPNDSVASSITFPNPKISVQDSAFKIDSSVEALKLSSMPIYKPRRYVNEMMVLIPREDIDYSLIILGPETFPLDIEINLNGDQ